MSEWTGPTCLMCDGTGEDFTYSGEPMEVARRDVPTGRPCRSCNGHGRDATPCSDSCPFAGCPSCEYAGGATVSVTYGELTDRLGGGHESVPAPASTGRGRGRTEALRQEVRHQ